MLIGLEAVRKRPAMYFGDLRDAREGRGVETAREDETVRAFVNSQPTSSEVVMPGVREGLRRVAHHFHCEAELGRLALGLIGAVHVAQRDQQAPVDELVADAIANALPASLEVDSAAKARFLARCGRP